MLWHEILGMIGIFCFLGAYFQLQRGVWGASDMRYLWVNLTGALLILVSLWADWNLPSFILEVAWALITLYGIVKALKNRKV